MFCSLSQIDQTLRTGTQELEMSLIINFLDSQRKQHIPQPQIVDLFLYSYVYKKYECFFFLIVSNTKVRYGKKFSFDRIFFFRRSVFLKIKLNIYIFSQKTPNSINTKTPLVLLFCYISQH